MYTMTVWHHVMSNLWNVFHGRSWSRTRLWWACVIYILPVLAENAPLCWSWWRHIISELILLQRHTGVQCIFYMITTSSRNIFRVTGHLCGEFTGGRWIPRTKASDAALWCILWSAPSAKPQSIPTTTNIMSHTKCSRICFFLHGYSYLMWIKVMETLARRQSYICI